ncbi:MAG: hypothetical protein E3J91_02055 [Hadesarchaea archaeon]|nr:MAG: hypothetical protein E3J91_02055 [Hadesarchaea archaeon]
MSVRAFGAVCDVSALVDRTSFERAQRLLDGGDLYLPSATYNWLARDKLIAVRGNTLGYSLVSQFVRDRKLLVVYLPELLDELSRRLLFEVQREVPLTDLRALMFAAHLRLPLLTFDEGVVERLREYVGARILWQLNAHSDWLALREALELYRELASDVGNYLCKNLNDGRTSENLIDELRSWRGDSLRAVTTAVRKLSQTRTNPGELNFRYITWDLTPILREYLKQHVLQPEVVHELCERALLLVASPK